jgi:hypothetical protein
MDPEVEMVLLEAKVTRELQACQEEIPEIFVFQSTNTFRLRDLIQPCLEKVVRSLESFKFLALEEKVDLVVTDKEEVPEDQVVIQTIWKIAEGNQAMKDHQEHKETKDRWAFQEN